MKIIDLKTLLAQKPGVLFTTYESLDVGHFRVFGGAQSLGGNDENIDFSYAELDVSLPHMPTEISDWKDFWFNHLEKGGDAKPDFQCQGRDGLFDTEAEFILLDKEDVSALFREVARSLTSAYDVTDLAQVLGDLKQEEDPFA